MKIITTNYKNYLLKIVYLFFSFFFLVSKHTFKKIWDKTWRIPEISITGNSAQVNQFLGGRDFAAPISEPHEQDQKENTIAVNKFNKNSSK